MIKTLTRSLREYKKSSALTIFLSILEAAFEITIPLCMAEVIDKGIDLGNMNNVWKYGIALLIFAAFQLITGVLSAHIAAKTSVGFSANLRQDMYDNVQTFAFSNIDKFSTASIVTRLTTDVTNIQNAYQMLIRMAIRGPVMLLFSMIVSFRINSTVAWIFLAVIPIMAILLLFIVKKVNPVFNRVFHTYDRLNNVVQENVRGIRVVKSFNREDYEIGKFKDISKSIYNDFAKGERLLAFNSPIMQFFMYMCMILISWIGAKAIVASGNNAALGMTTGDLTALFSYATQILMSLMMLSMIFAMLTISLTSGRRIAEILEEKTDISNPANPEMTVKDGSIHFENVDFVYASKADKRVLNISSIQLGATVDYAILMTDRYKENRQSMAKKEAVKHTISDVTVSILTSGSVLTVCGLLLGYMSTNQLLAQLGIFIGRGAIFSLAIVLFVLPGLLYIFDKLITRTKGKTHKEAIK
ncbi:MAG: ABC transporter transmembrane domain-containing protein [Oscillospiraceae bacterium]|nr:ABC transporter transmembrane domain-containing protein [Oscillospiraceae bacterium]MDY3065775.1 ABC transporter transmembrane domain-containing protein [Oscillospiraceae bacterium]